MHEGRLEGTSSPSPERSGGKAKGTKERRRERWQSYEEDVTRAFFAARIRGLAKR
jgi:hypothetical protein